jgi:type IV pilus assembly protein PilV
VSPLHVNSRSRGFSLLEVMVSLIVICVGLLGIAKLQALSLSNTTTSRLRALAAIQAASMASAMHSNRQYWGNTPPLTVTVSETAAPAAIASTDAALQTQATTDITGTTASNPSTVCIGTVGGGPLCNALQLAAFDLARWSVSVAPLLPNATATISCPPIPGGGPASCMIQISWSEKAVAINQQQAGAAANSQFQNPTYTLYVEP